MRAGSTMLVLAAAIGCGPSASPVPPANRVPPPPPLRDDLCKVFERLVSAASHNFLSIDASHDRSSGGFDSSVKPSGATRAYFAPCCASESGEWGPWTWITEWTGEKSPARYFARLRTRLMACPITRRLGEPHVAPYRIRWEAVKMKAAVELSVRRSDVSLSVSQAY
jgi:hypothetical protein